MVKAKNAGGSKKLLYILVVVVVVLVIAAAYFLMSNVGSGNITGTAPHIVGTIKGFDGGGCVIDIAANGTYVYFSYPNPGTYDYNSTVTVVSALNNMVVSTRNTTTGLNFLEESTIYDPVGMVVDSQESRTPNGEIGYVPELSNNTVAIVSTKNNTVIGVITGFNMPSGVAVAPNGAYAYVTNLGGSTVSIVDLSTNKVTGTITGFIAPSSVAIAPDGTAYVCNEWTMTHPNVVAIVK